MEDNHVEDEYAIYCPKCGKLTFYIKYFGNKTGYYCNHCSYWEDCK